MQSKPAIIIGTGYSLRLNRDYAAALKAAGKAMLFGINNTFEDFDLDVWIACDPAWHKHFGKVEGSFERWHWDIDICDRFGYHFIEGLRNQDGSVLEGIGLSLDPNSITLGHSSGWQALNLALHHGCDPICLIGYDMEYKEGEPRHYFDELSDQAGEYPAELRKFSLFDKPNKTGLLYDYKQIADQCDRNEIPQIYNCTIGSAMKWFPIKPLEEVVPL